MSPPLAYFLTWTTYGTWLPGDDRRWVDKHEAGAAVPYRLPDPGKRGAAQRRMREEAVYLDPRQRRALDAALRETCAFREWPLHALNVRSNHVHIVVTVPDVPPGKVMRTLKAWASRTLNQVQVSAKREHWWTKGGSKRYLNDDRSVAGAVRYVEHQDHKHARRHDTPPAPAGG